MRSGTFHVRHTSCWKGSCGAWAETVSGQPGRACRPAFNRSASACPGARSEHATDSARPVGG
ncbi:hypothetical protein, partial [Streptomyces xanthophaeus]|uniref:hypothetical protein n=1 Tax=Streptomyces xanthophaeus TaxID=67385 RepID=UPI0036493086